MLHILEQYVSLTVNVSKAFVPYETSILFTIRHWILQILTFWNHGQCFASQNVRICGGIIKGQKFQSLDCNISHIFH